MKVLQICAYAAPYAGNFIKSLCALDAALEKRGIETVYAFPETARTKPWAVDLSDRRTCYFLPLTKARILPKTYGTLQKIFRDNPDIHIAHSHFELYDFPLVMMAPKHTAVFWHLHDAIASISGLKHRVAHKVQYGLFHRRVRLLSVAEKHLDYVVRLGFPKENSELIPNGIDTDSIHLVEREWQNRRYDFLMFGWVYKRKAVDVCAEACKKRSRPANVAIVGNEDTKRRLSEQFGAVAGLSVINPVNDVNDLLCDTKCFLHISRDEGQSYALLESLYAGLPVICTNIPSNSFASQFPTVRMIASEDAIGLMSTMDEFLSNGEPTKLDVEATRRIIDENYSISSWVKRIIVAYGLVEGSL